MSKAKRLLNLIEDLTMGWVDPNSVNYFPANTAMKDKKVLTYKCPNCGWNSKDRSKILPWLNCPDCDGPVDAE